MAGTFKNTLDSAETTADVVEERVISYEVNVTGQTCTIRLAKFDSGDNQIGRQRTETFALTGTDLSTPTTTIFTAAKTAGKTAAGTITEV